MNRYDPTSLKSLNGPFFLMNKVVHTARKLSSAFFAMAAILAQSQTQSFEQQMAGLNKLPSLELKTRAEKNEPMAVYCYGLREWQEAWKDNQAAFAWSFASTANRENLPDSEQHDAMRKWAAAPESIIIAAGKAGDRGAAWLFGKQGAAKARQRGLKAFENIKKAADAGIAPAQYEIAIRHLGLSDWEIVAFDPGEGLRYLQMSASGNLEIAQHTMADLVLEGKLVPRDLKNGIEYLRRAVDHDCPRAQCELAWQYMNGNAEPRRNNETVLALLKKSADQNYNMALVELGHHYRAGLGVAKNNSKALTLYKKAAELDESLDEPCRTGIAGFLATWEFLKAAP
jgi:TPR repeat protein